MAALHYAPFDVQNVITLHDYLFKKKQYSNFKNFFSNRKKLISIPLLLCNDTIVTFNDYSTKTIELKIGKKRIQGADFFDIKAKGEKYSRILNTDYAPYGIGSEDTEVTYISSIKINGVPIDNIAFQDLLNPNVYKTYLSIKPINAFVSKNNIYVYIFGE